MSKKTKRRQRMNPDRILAGTADVGPQQLIDLIHRINPTGMALADADREARYRQKSALQSRLVRDFGEELRVAADPQQAQLVTLKYRGRDACHAVLADLDPDARAWVQRRLDQQQVEVGSSSDTRNSTGTGAKASTRRTKSTGDASAEPAEAGSPDTTGLSADELLALATKAMADYDYQAAESLYSQACKRSGQEPAAAIAYLGFLVDTLGDDQAALEAGMALPAPLRSNAEIRLLLGAAAARSGQDQAAESYLGHLSGPDAAAICRTLCAHALAADAAERAQFWLDQAHQRDSDGQAKLLGLSEQLAALRQRLRRPQEEAIQRLVDAGDLDAAQEQAQACLAQWPDSRVARAVIARIDASHQRQQMEDHLDHAHQALDQGDYQQAVRRFEQALVLGCNRQQVKDDLARAQRLLDDAHDQARLRQLRERLAAGDRGPALLDYLDSPPAVREHARTALRLPLLDWLEALGTPRSAAKARAAVEAVAALEQAVQALEQDELERAERLLQPHARVLEGLPQAQSLSADIHTRRAGKRRASAWKAVEQAGQTLNDGRTDAALAQLDAVPQEALSEPQKTQYMALQQRARQQDQMDGLRKRLAGLSAEADCFDARAVLEQLLGLAEGQEQTALQAQRQALQDRIDRRWRVPVTLSPDFAHLLPLANDHANHDESRTWLFGDDAESPPASPPPAIEATGHRYGLVVAIPLQQWLLIALLDPVTRGLLRYVVLEPPEPLVGRLALNVRGQHAVIIDRKGRLLQIGLDGWRIEQWLALAPYLPATEEIEQVVYSPGERFCWVQTSDPDLNLHLHLIDLQQRRLRRELHSLDLSFVISVAGRPGTILYSDEFSGMRLYGDGGKRLCDYPGFTQHQVIAAAALPKQQTVILSFDTNDEDDEQPLIVSLVDQDHQIAATQRLPGSNGELLSELAVCQSRSLIFVLYYRAPSEWSLVALHCIAAGDGAELELLYRVPVYGNSDLLHNESGHTVSLLTQTVEDGPYITPLDETIPRFSPGTAPSRSGIPVLSPPFISCGDPIYSFPSADEIAQFRFPATGTDLSDWASAQRKTHAISEANRPGNEPLQMVAALLSAQKFDILERLTREAVHEQDDDFLIVITTLLLRDGAWEQVRAILEPIMPSLDDWDLTEHRRQHIHHLLGLAQYHDQSPEQAIATWRQGQALEGECRLDATIDLATYVSHGPDLSTPIEQRPLVHRLLTWIDAADQALLAGDPAGAVGHLDQPELWAVKEIQGLARLVYALLEWDEATPHTDFLRAVAIVSFLDARKPKSILAPVRLVFPTEWEQARIEALAQRGKDWLARTLARPEHDLDAGREPLSG